MTWTDGLKVKGNVDWTLYDADGNVKMSGSTPNQIQAKFLKGLARLISTSTAAFWNIIEMGAGTGTGQSTSDNTLNSAHGDGNEAVTYSETDTTVTFSNTWAAGASTGTLTEFGCFSTGTMMMYDDNFGSGIPKGAADTLTVNWTLTFA